MQKRYFFTSLFFLCTLQFSFTQEYDSHKIYEHIQSIQGSFGDDSKYLFSTNRNFAVPDDAKKYVSKAYYHNLEEAFSNEIKNQKPSTLALSIPMEDKSYEVLLYRKDVTTSSYQVKSASGKKTTKSKSIFYRGIIKGDKNSVVSLAILSNSIHMTIANDQGNYEINKIQGQLYAGYRVSDSKHTQDIGCSTGSTHVNKNVKITDNREERSIGDCIEVYIECDFDSFQKNGSSIQNTEDWALGIMNEVGILYENEGIPIVVSDILVYDVADPYLGGSDAGDMLDIMPSVVGNYDGRLAHVFSTRSVGGGIAWVNVLCSQNNGNSGPFAVSGSMNTNVVPFPIYSWNVMVVAHEMGHNIGSRHTHDCEWNGNDTQIDDCGSEADDVQPCYDENNPILPTSGGTIMSYCHIIGSVGINFNNGFGPQPGALLLDRYLGASCVTGDDCSGGGNGGPPPIADFTFTQFNPCAPSEVQFNDLSTESPTQFEWVMLGATPNFSTEQNPFVVYNEPGFFDVTLTVTNSDGSDDLTLTQVIEVNEVPIPDFTYELIGENVSFTNQTNISVNSYFWDFGDGSSSTEENPVHTYVEEGTYEVSLVVGNICGPTSTEQFVDIFLPPTAAFSADTTSGCTPLSINYSNNSSDNASSFLWTFEGGIPASSTAENPTVLYEESGNYDVILKVSNQVGVDSIIETSYISIQESPTVDFDVLIDALVVDFENTSEGYDEVMWDFGDGNSSTQEEPSHTYEMEGIYEVTLNVTNICGTVEMSQTIDLNTFPSAGFNTDVSVGCLPFTVIYSNTSSSNSDTWEWSFPGGNPSSSTEENPTVVYEMAGTYDATLTVTNEMGSDSELSIDLISVQDVPETDFTYSTNDFNVEFMDLSTNYESLFWNFGDGNTSVEQNPTHTFATEGTYEVVLSATNECGTISQNKTIVISTLPTADYSATITGGCVPFSVEYTNNSSSNVMTWDWSFPGGIPNESTDESPTVTYSEPGLYNVTLIVSSAAGKDTLMKMDYITTQDVPSSNFDYTVSSLYEFSFNNSSTNAISYSWDFGDGNMSTEENPNHIYFEDGMYTVILTASNECGSKTYEEVIIIEATAIGEIDILNNAGVFPNPNQGEFILSMNSSESGKIHMEIYNILGQQIISEQFNISSGQNNKDIDLAGASSGAYLMVLRKDDRRQVIKFFIH